MRLKENIRLRKIANMRKKKNAALSPMAKLGKRLFDLICGVVGFTVLFPFMTIIYITIKISDRGPAIFKQKRIGMGGKPFTLYKFRSMRMDAEAGGTPQLYAGDEDERLTRVGLFSRATLYNGYTDTMEKMLERLRMDLEYLDHFSPWEDIKIVTLTAFSIISGKKF